MKKFHLRPLVSLGLMVVLLTFLSCIVSMVLVLCEFGVILGDGYGIEGQNYVALLQGSGMPAGFYSRNLILGIECFRLLTFEHISLV